MKLKTAIEDYVRHKENLGTDFEESARLLRRCGRIWGDISVNDLTPEATKSFIFGNGPVSSTLHTRFLIIRGLIRYMLARNYITSSPLPVDIPKKPEGLIPHIYSKAELRRILTAAKTYSGQYKIDAPTLYTFILLLYACGLRRSEALRLTLGDVDLNENIITVRDTKFYKTRYVPFSADLARVLRGYLRMRSQNGHPAPPEAFLLVTVESTPIQAPLAGKSFRRVCASAGVRRRHPHERYGPRLHDLRHTFSVHRLTACYQEGGDPQCLLPKLSTYLGHVDIRETQPYLTLTPELLRYASRRFEDYAITGGRRD